MYHLHAHIAKTIAQNFPDHQYPSIIGRPILRTEEQSSGDVVLKDIMCGDEAAAARSMLQITYPVCDHLDMWEDSKSSTANLESANL